MLEFSSIPKDGSDIHRFPKVHMAETTSCWKICEITEVPAECNRAIIEYFCWSLKKKDTTSLLKYKSNTVVVRCAFIIVSPFDILFISFRVM